MPLYISAEVGSSFFSAFNVFLSQLGDVLNSLFHISIGGVSIGIIWISLSIMLTIIALTINVIRNGASNTVATSNRYMIFDRLERRNNNSWSETTSFGFRNKDGTYTRVSNTRRFR